MTSHSALVNCLRIVWKNSDKLCPPEEITNQTPGNQWCQHSLHNIAIGVKGSDFQFSLHDVHAQKRACLLAKSADIISFLHENYIYKLYHNTHLVDSTPLHQHQLHGLWKICIPFLRVSHIIHYLAFSFLWQALHTSPAFWEQPLMSKLAFVPGSFPGWLLHTNRETDNTFCWACSRSWSMQQG